MLKLGLGLSLSSIRPQGVWSPDDESSLEAWYQNAVGITLDETSATVSRWDDSSSNTNHMIQATDTEQPGYEDGTLTFDSGETQNLQTLGQITLTEQFVIGFRAKPSATNVVILADNTTSNESVKYSTTSRIIVKIAGSQKSLDLDSGAFGDDYIVISRDASDLITLYHNGTPQSAPKTLAGECLIDAIGVRATDLNPFDGDVEEVQIYSSTSTALIANVNARLASI